MRTIYTNIDYKKALRELVEERKSLDPSLTFEKVAQAMGVQKSYLSRTLREDAIHLSADQLFKGCQFLKLSPAETEYLELLLELTRCEVAGRKQVLEQKIRRIQQRKAQTDQQLPKLGQAPDVESMQPFYLDAVHQLVHICLTIPRFQADPASRIAQALGLSRKKIAQSLRLLETLDLVERKDEKWRAKVQQTHLPPNSPYFLAWRSQLRLLSANRQQCLEPGESYSFSVVFSATPETQNRIRYRFLEFLKEVRKEVENTQPENCYQMNFDLLPWA